MWAGVGEEILQDKKKAVKKRRLNSVEKTGKRIREKPRACKEESLLEKEEDSPVKGEI